MTGYNSPRLHLVFEWRNNDCVALHEVTVPGLGQKGGYVQGVSISAFGGRELDHWYNKFYLKGIKCPRRFDHDWQILSEEIEGQRRIDKERTYADLPYLKYPDLWSFYKAIGYDHKKQRYGPMPEIIHASK